MLLATGVESEPVIVKGCDEFRVGVVKMVASGRRGLELWIESESNGVAAN